MTKLIFNLLAFLTVIGCMLSCQQLADEEESVSSDGNSALKIKTRSAGSSQIIYPIYLYAFSEEGDCAASQKIASEANGIELLLPAGKYRVVAVSGVSKGYVLPENPTVDNVITMKKDNCAQSPMMIGKADVTIGKSGKDVALEVTLTYAVASLSIDLKNVPSGVSGVKVTLSPIYSSLSMEGEYGGESGKVEVDCTLDTENIWCVNSLYVFPGSGTETVCSILLETKSGTETYAYTYDGIPLANHPFNLGGNYKGDVTVGGNFIAKDWEQPINVDFTFGNEDATDDDNDNGSSGDDDSGDTPDGDEDISGLPEVGSIWNDCIVVGVSNVGNKGADLLLMSLDEWESTVSDAESMIAGYFVGSIKNWRFPTEPEAKQIRDKFNGHALNDLNEKILSETEDYAEIVNDSETRYLCTKAGTLYSFQFVAGKTVTKAGSKKSYLMRVVTTYHYSK